MTYCNPKHGNHLMLFHAWRIIAEKPDANGETALNVITTSEYQIIRKSNAITRASFFMSIIEQRLVMFAVSVATRSGLTEDPNFNSDTPIVLRFADYARAFGTDWANARRDLRKAATGLLGKQIFFENPDGDGFDVDGQVWLNRIQYDSAKNKKNKEQTAEIWVTFNAEIIQHLCQLAIKGYYTQTYFEYMAKFKSSYSIRLYELCMSWINMRDCKSPSLIPLEHLRAWLGVEPEKYLSVGDFKRYVLNKAVAEVSKITDIKVVCDDVITNRKITHFNIKSIRKNTKNKKTPAIFFDNKQMSAAQRGFFSSKLAALPEFQKYTKPSQSFSDFKDWICVELGKTNRLKEWWPLLEQAGFKYHALLTDKVGEAEAEAEAVIEKSYWSLKKIKQAAFSLSQDSHFMEAEAHGLKPDEACEWMQEVLEEKKGREEHWNHLKRHVPEGVTP